MVTTPEKPQSTPPVDDVLAEVQAADRGQTRKAWERYLDAELGLRNYWYPAFFSTELADGQTRSETLLGERIYFKRIKGQVFGVEDRCPHRGVNFSARPECYTTNTISCWLHGFTFDMRDGQLTAVLSETNSSMVGKLTVKTYPCYERYGVVFVWIGDTAPVGPAEDMPPTFMRENLITRPLLRARIRCNWRMACENGFDNGHVYGHRNWSAAWRYGPRPLGAKAGLKEDLRVVDEPGKPKGLLFGRQSATWVGHIVDEDEEVWVHHAKVDPQNPPPARNEVVKGDRGCFLPCSFDTTFPRADLHHWEWYVPIDEDHHMYWVVQGADGSTEEQRQTFVAEWHDHLARDTWDFPGNDPEGFNNFDALGRFAIHQAYSQEDWWHRERMYGPDYVIIQWRKLVAEQARGIQRRGDWQRLLPDEPYQQVYYGPDDPTFKDEVPS